MNLWNRLNHETCLFTNILIHKIIFCKSFDHELSHHKYVDTKENSQWKFGCKYYIQMLYFLRDLWHHKHVDSKDHFLQKNECKYYIWAFTLQTCWFNWLFCEKVLLQTLHSNGFVPSWADFVHIVKKFFVWNRYDWQKVSHLKGLFSSWIEIEPTKAYIRNLGTIM